MNTDPLLLDMVVLSRWDEAIDVLDAALATLRTDLGGWERDL
jgi:hypothetical protein